MVTLVRVGNCYVVPCSMRSLTTLLRAGSGRMYISAVIGLVRSGNVILLTR